MNLKNRPRTPSIQLHRWEQINWRLEAAGGVDRAENVVSKGTEFVASSRDISDIMIVVLLPVAEWLVFNNKMKKKMNNLWWNSLYWQVVELVVCHLVIRPTTLCPCRAINSNDLTGTLAPLMKMHWMSHLWVRAPSPHPLPLIHPCCLHALFVWRLREGPGNVGVYVSIKTPSPRALTLSLTPTH